MLPPAVRRQAQALLVGEPIEYLFPAVIRTSVLGNVFVAVTGDAIVVLTAGFFGRNRPRSVLARYLRSTGIGPVDDRGVPTFTLGGVIFEVEPEYLAVIAAVDAERGGDALPPDPLPDL